MAKINSLKNAKAAKNDEYYTLYDDVAAECDFQFGDCDRLRDKVVFLPCDHPDRSAFTRYFLENFDRLKLQKLISTSYNIRGRGAILETTRDGFISIGKLKGNGDFRSEEVTSLRDTADVIVTNPPFSLLKEFYEWIKEKEDLLFLIVVPYTFISYKCSFYDLTDGVFSVSSRSYAKNMKFRTALGIRSVCATWITNIKPQPKPALDLFTYSQNVSKWSHRYPRLYRRYSNFDAIEVPALKAIPADYDGMMGVPVTAAMHNTDAFNILGVSCVTRVPGKYAQKYLPLPTFEVDGKAVFKRVLIKNKLGQK